jgi:hypothetical protein
LRAESIGQIISDCEFRILDFLVFFFNPHSAIGIPHLNCPPVPWNRRRLMISARNALTSGPGTAFNLWTLIRFLESEGGK